MQNSKDPFQLTRFFDKLRTTLSYQKRIKAPGDELGILIACSGGIDSLALLYSMNGLKDELGLKLGACYVDHKARPESAMEAKFVDKICQGLQIPFFSAEFSNNFWSESKSNFEEKAREERYRLLGKVAMDNDFNYIATAHHADDQIETMLMRILERGTGIKGLCGIRPVKLCKGDIYDALKNGTQMQGAINLAPTITIIRPMLNISKDEIIEYMAERQYLSDSTNNDAVYRRNFYRNVVIPALKEALPGVNIGKHLSELAENVQREQSVMEDIMREFWGLTHPGSSTSSEPPLSLPKRGGGGELYLSRTLIESKSDDFWLTAFSYLFSFGDVRANAIHPYSHSTQTLKDIVAFIRKRDPGIAHYNPYIFQRDKEGVKLTPAPLLPKEG